MGENIFFASSTLSYVFLRLRDGKLKKKRTGSVGKNKEKKEQTEKILTKKSTVGDPKELRDNNKLSHPLTPTSF